MMVSDDASKDIAAKKANVTDLVSYQKASVVSRTIIDKGSGTVTLFAFDEGQGLSEHTAPFDALVHVLDGEAEVTIAGKSHKLSQGDVIIMPANEPHAVRAVRKFKMMLVMVRS
jgi:quercetin dioxygenase-like cupin family protein